MKYLFALILICISFISKSQPFRPDFHLKSDRYTNLLVFDADRSDGIFPILDSAPFRHIKFWAENWRKPDQWVSWNVIADKDDQFLVNVVCNPLQSDIDCFVESGQQSLHIRITKQDTAEFLRTQLNGRLFLHSGINKILLRIKSSGKNPEFNVSVHGIELIRPSVKKKYDDLISVQRRKTNADWFLKCRYGIFTTWTSQVYPRNGERLSYDSAVTAFDIDGYVNQIVRTGAGLVVFNTSHAEMYFPAPIHPLDSIIPGRTSKRDLIDELYKALSKHGIKLFLYYHLGCVWDPEWAKASGLWETNEKPFFDRWNRVIKEIGKRYGKKISGYWFDDGSTNYYYRSPDWLTMYSSAKTGNPDRLVGYNPWKLPPPTLFMDYYLGETNLDPSMHGQLKKYGNGIIQSGPYAGLYASSTFVTESEDWGHFKKNSDIDETPFRYTADSLANMLKEFQAYKNLPLINLEIYQNGLMSERSIKIFEQAKALLSGSNYKH